MFSLALFGIFFAEVLKIFLQVNESANDHEVYNNVATNALNLVENERKNVGVNDDKSLFVRYD